ncbi:MAG: hypothetical protein COA53_02195 [Rhodobacteraceae bacterium]|nr:MAG: hypothetical protein COA53_02195 [Paracoccaceae bacterium]
MKLLALTTALTVAASTAFAQQAPAAAGMIIEEAGPMGGSELWIVPLLLIGIVLLLGSNGTAPINEE